MSKDEGRRDDPPASADPSPDTEPPADDTRAKDLLADQPVRRAVGERLSRRVGGRRFDRAPIVSCTGKIFARYELADPWDPDTKDRPVALGPVGMRFEDRRQPAPHAKVKQPKSKKSDRPAWTPPKGIPDARAGSKPSPPPPKPAPAPRAATPPRPAAPPEPVEDQPAPLPPKAPPPRGKVQPKRSSGRFRMRPTSTSGPKVRQVTRVVEAPEPDQGAPEPEPHSPPPAAPQSLDDLFGSLGAGGRDKRVGRKKD